jgi:CspA family cold shock protein
MPIAPTAPAGGAAARSGARRAPPARSPLRRPFRPLRRRNARSGVHFINFRDEWQVQASQASSTSASHQLPPGRSPALTIAPADLLFRPNAPISAMQSRPATDLGLRAAFPSHPLLRMAATALAPPQSRPKEKTMPIGTVKFFNTDKGFGFIQPDGSGNDAFVHISAVEKAGMSTLNKDQRVTYELEQDARGKTSAVNLQNA